MLILTGVDRMPDLAAILDRHSDLDVSIDHMASAPLDDPDKQQLLLDMARFPRVYVKISHTWSSSDSTYPWADSHDLVEEGLSGIWRKAHHVGDGLARLLE